MNKDEFNSLEVMDQVEYINNLLENKKTLTSISKDLNIGRSTISDRFKKIGYRYNKQLNQYLKFESNTDVIQSNIIIDLPEADSELTSFRVNKEILKQFNEFVKKQKEFRKIDLVSMALKEYIENYGK